MPLTLKYFAEKGAHVCPSPQNLARRYFGSPVWAQSGPEKPTVALEQPRIAPA